MGLRNDLNTTPPLAFAKKHVKSKTGEVSPRGPSPQDLSRITWAFNKWKEEHEGREERKGRRGYKRCVCGGRSRADSRAERGLRVKGCERTDPSL